VQLPVHVRHLRDQLAQAIDDACSETAYHLYLLGQFVEDLLMEGTQIAEMAAERTEDFRQAGYGNKRVACQWCDGEFYVDSQALGPHTCWMCRHCDGY
jgi:hypothetical protein